MSDVLTPEECAAIKAFNDRGPYQCDVAALLRTVASLRADLSRTQLERDAARAAEKAANLRIESLLRDREALRGLAKDAVSDVHISAGEGHRGSSHVDCPHELCGRLRGAL